MFIAHDSNKNRIEISNASKDEDFFCPICSSKLIVKSGNIKKRHFAHKTGHDCDEWDSDMSEWHYNWQQKFHEEFREVLVEHDGKKHRADVLINDIVIEFQHSKISKEEFNERTKFYVNAGYKVIWLFDLISFCNDNKILADEISPVYRYYRWKWAPHTFDNIDLHTKNVLLFFEMDIYNTKRFELFLRGNGSEFCSMDGFYSKRLLDITSQKEFETLISCLIVNKLDFEGIKDPWLRINFTKIKE